MFPNLSDNLDLALALYGIDTEEDIDALAASLGIQHFEASDSVDLAAAYGLACSGRMMDCGLMTDPRIDAGGFEVGAGYSADAALNHAAFDALHMV